MQRTRAKGNRMVRAGVRTVATLTTLLVAAAGMAVMAGVAVSAGKAAQTVGKAAQATRMTSTVTASAMHPFRPASARAASTGPRFTQAFSIRIPHATGFNESYPVEQGGVLYVTTSQARVVALDAANGRVLWQYAPTLHLAQGIPETNRGVAVGPRYIYVLTADDQLIALRPENGRPVFDASVADVNIGYFETMAPLYADGRVIVGASGGDEGVRGFVAAYDANTGRFLWRYYTVPARGSGWMPATGDHGGGAVWTTPTYSPKTGLVYIGTGNPSPDYYGVGRPGPDLYTDSVVALALNRGTPRWYRQEVPHDLWDYDVASPPILFPVRGGLAVGEAGKDGYWYEWDAKSGRALTRPVAFVREAHSPPTAAGVKEWPGADGGANYGPSAYDPATRDAYIAGINGPEVLYAGPTEHSSYETDFGTHQGPAPRSDWKGTITAVNTLTGRIVWKIKTPSPPIGGVTYDGDGTVSFGLPDGGLYVLSAATGRAVWHARPGAPIGMAPVVYRLAGRTYMAVTTGGSASLAALFPWSGADRLIVYRITG